MRLQPAGDEETPFLRVLVLIAFIVFLRTFLTRPTRRTSSQTSPYRNSLDGMISARHLSAVLDEIHHQEAPARGRRAVS